MFETGMSALVLKICSEYAKSLGLNFPPCTQQEINAICQWVDKHAVKDMTISQDGYTVTFTFKGEYDTTKEFTITIPKTIDVEELAKVLVGSESVVVERLENNSGLRVRLDQSVLDNINSKLTKPANPTAESAVTMLADGTVGTKLLSEIGGGGGGGGGDKKLYLHKINALLNSGSGEIYINIINNSNTSLTENDYFHTCIGSGIVGCFNGSNGHGAVNISYSPTSNKYRIKGVLAKDSNSGYYLIIETTFQLFIDTVTEL